MTTGSREAVSYDPRQGQAVYGPVALFPLPPRMPDIIEGEMGYRWAGLGETRTPHDLARGWEQEAKHNRIVLNETSSARPFIDLQHGSHATRVKGQMTLHRAKPVDPDLPQPGFTCLWNSRELSGLLLSFGIISTAHFHLPVRFLIVDERPIAVKCPKRPALIVPPGIYCVLNDPLLVPEPDERTRWDKVRRDHFPDPMFQIALEID